MSEPHVFSESTPEIFKKRLAALSFQPSPSSAPTTWARTKTEKPRPIEASSPRRSAGGTLSDPKPSRTRTVPRVHSPRTKAKRGFAPAEQYKHLEPLPDYLVPNLDIAFCGINPGQKSAEIGHHFGGPTNHFWPCLYESGLTNVRLRPIDDSTLPERFAFGLTNLVGRPTAEQNELSQTEQFAAVPDLLDKIACYRPRIVCIVGLGITKTIRSHVLSKLPKKKGGKAKDPPACGLQPFKLAYDTPGTETLFFTVSSTSGRVVQYQKSHKVEQFRELKTLLEKIKAGQVDTSGIQIIGTSVP